MALLSDSNRRSIWAEYMSIISSRRESANLLKADLRAAINAVDSWIDTNASSYNSSLPLPARTVLTAKQKAELMVYVIQRRWEVT